MSAFRQELPATLPTTFTDAIKVARQIQSPFLWIDSICIIQDSKEDWSFEASLMGDVYKHAWCTIAATRAKNGTEGMLSDDGGDIGDLVEVEAKLNQAQTTTFQCWSTSFISNNINQSPLNRRGWVVQERVLSTRIIHFAKEQVIWECCTMQACETFPEGIPQPHDYEKPRLDFIIQPPVHDDLARWRKYVELYSRCSLTQPAADKLLAFSGLARGFGLAENYMVGLWKDRLMVQLDWVTERTSHLQPLWRAPTWSWASLDGEVVLSWPYEEGLISDIAVFKGFKVDLATDDPFGAVKSASLDLDNYVLQIHEQDWTFEIEDDSTSTRENKTNLESRYGHVNLVARADTQNPLDVMKYFVLPLSAANPDIHFLNGILVEPAEKPGKFYRRGACTFWTWAWEDDSSAINDQIFQTFWKQALETAFRYRKGSAECESTGEPSIREISRQMVTLV